jgi:hypothetical protein
MFASLNVDNLRTDGIRSKGTALDLNADSLRTDGISEAILSKIEFAEQTNGRGYRGHTSDMFYLFRFGGRKQTG